MLKIFYLILFLLTVACNKHKNINGHWHEYNKNKSNFLHCYKVTDSLIAIDNQSYGICYANEKCDLKLESGKIITFSNKTPFNINYKKINTKIILNDSIYWIKQTNNTKMFISDFSASLFVNVIPKETKKFDLEISNIECQLVFIYIGIPKSDYLKNNPTIIKNKHYLQLNDKITNTKSIKDFLSCCNCNYSNKLFLIHADKDTPKKILSELENEINRFSINRNQIYYLAMNSTKKTFGYNKTTNY